MPNDEQVEGMFDDDEDRVAAGIITLAMEHFRPRK